MKTLATLIGFTLVATAALAQPLPRHPGRAVEEGQILSQFFQIRATRIQQCLGLSDDRSRALAERWGRWDREVMDRLRRMNEARQGFNQVLLGAETDEVKNAKLKPLLEQFLHLRAQQEDAKRRFEEEVMANLTPIQKVRLIILVEDLQPKLRGLLRDSRGRGGRY